MKDLSFDELSLTVDGKRTFLISGEFHYFRVPHDDWRRRLRLLKDDGTVYHWYCAVSRRNGREVRGIALAMSELPAHHDLENETT